MFIQFQYKIAYGISTPVNNVMGAITMDTEVIKFKTSLHVISWVV